MGANDFYNKQREEGQGGEFWMVSYFEDEVSTESGSDRAS